MSDAGALKQKVRQGREWRGNIRVSMDGEEHELVIRQLVDPEIEEVMDLIDRDELQQLRDELPDDLLEDMRELQDKDEELTDKEEEELAELQEQLEDESVDMFDIFSADTMKGFRLAGKYAVEPDDGDLRQMFKARASEVEAEYGIKVQEPEDVYDAWMDEMHDVIENSIKFVGFNIGLQALMATVDEEGN